jgi:hypothetical protein
MYNVFLKLFLIKNTFKSFFLYFIFYINILKPLKIIKNINLVFFFYEKHNLKNILKIMH